MSQLIHTDGLHLVVGMGATGLSIAQHLCAQGFPVAVIDTRAHPSQWAAVRALPVVACYCGQWPQDLITRTSQAYISPGLALNSAPVAEILASGIRVSSDIALFFEAFQGPVVAITGSNGKSTVTTLVGAMALHAGFKVGVGGNLGVPALSLLAESMDLAVLELSSFQLELLDQVPAQVATVLNVTPDHMDRYPTFESYHQAKHRIFRGCRRAVINTDNSLTVPLLPAQVPMRAYRTGRPVHPEEWGVQWRDDVAWLAKGSEYVMPVTAMKLRGVHNWHNVLAALALGEAVGFSLEAMLEALRTFAGLEHRCEWVGEIRGVGFINDSKGTNPMATLAALEGLGSVCPGRLLWIAGGQSKGADFKMLLPAVQKYVRRAFFIGEARDQLSQTFTDIPQKVVSHLKDAVHAAMNASVSGDWVVLSPACASFDQFTHFMHRGQAFKAWVRAL